MNRYIIMCSDFDMYFGWFRYIPASQALDVLELDLHSPWFGSGLSLEFQGLCVTSHQGRSRGNIAITKEYISTRSLWLTRCGKSFGDSERSRR